MTAEARSNRVDTPTVQAQHPSETYPFSIRDLADEFDISLRTLRFYESRKILVPHRIGTRRRYSHEDRQRLGLLVMVKRLGFSLLEITNLIPLFEAAKSQKAARDKLISRLAAQKLILVEQRAEVDLSLTALSEAIRDLRAQHG